ncbi:Bona fide RidA/YjgF/TdcF/RutC subgroup [[Actinomadura] parvosata subsp. kistnae]|uniref:Reactive intermediate/imine deaminase n=1 Tax=[Actinomadura] parvosata subsp. kistnae TaxID=1909395 RepID=A0A1V0A8B7_9ACTN|nr:Rid family detoxifying hydrolase [Nonomuraea sp. ATCC 55076]AQZ66458.1 reactive intermediate/imine deaminase [Nonomuraea sp. ATCC 55076]SPL95480.1 Bona fide RidA/YjgF/TdcF/RutC subgroup [Actinomadura parvosata subsp. kistnae]
MKKELRTTEGAAPIGAYSQGLVVGDFVYTSGAGPLDPQTGEVVGDDVAAQTHQTMRNLGAILAAHGLGYDDVVKATVHLQHLKRDFAAFNEVYKSYFNQPYPVRTTVGSDLMDILVEIDFVAHKSA